MPEDAAPAEPAAPPAPAAPPESVHAAPADVTGAPRAGPRAWLGSLQSLRGLAALWVVLYHLDVALFSHGLELLPFPGPRVGWLGVDLFYVLSAYLLGQPFLDGRARPYGRFLADRFFRIAPAYYVAAAFAAASIAALGVAELRPEWAWYSLVFLTNVHVDAYFALNPAFWSLAVEMQFYLLLPFLARPFAGRRWPWALAACIAVSVLVRAATFHYWQANAAPQGDAPFNALFFGTFGMPSFLAHFGLGLAACRLRQVARPGWAALAAVPLVAAPVLLWIPLGSVVFGFESMAGQVLVRPLAAAGFALLILAAASAGPLRRALEVGVLRWLGDISYSLYLSHLPVQVAFDVWMGAEQNPWAWAAASTAASVAVGALLYYAVERPAERWRHQRKLRQRVAAQAAAAG